MNIGVIGSGNVGGALGTLWAGKNHQVVFGVRDIADHGYCTRPRVQDMKDRDLSQAPTPLLDSKEIPIELRLQ